MNTGFGKDSQSNSVITGEFEELKEEFFQTRIPGFDTILGDGLILGNVYVVSGKIETSYKLFCQQIMYNLLISKQKVSYYTVTESGNDISKDMKVYKMGISGFIDDGSLKFTKVVPPELKEVIDLLPENPMDGKVVLDNSLASLMNDINESASQKRNTILDVTDLIRHYPINQIQNLVLYVTGLARKYGGLHLILVSDDVDKEKISTIKNTADVVFDFSSDQRQNEIEDSLRITKTRGFKPKLKIIKFAHREHGLATETIRRI